MSELGRVIGLYRYPVKTMLGEQAESVQLDKLGIEDDRSWAVYDNTRGNFYVGKRNAGLMGCSAAGGDNRNPPLITLPNGESFSADDPECAKQLSELLDLNVSLWPIDPDSLPPSEVPEDINAMEEFQAISARIEGEPLPDFSNMPVSIETFRRIKHRPYSDLAPLMVMTQQSIDTIATEAPDSKIDVRRFRPSILFDAPDGGALPENDWVGGRFKLGEAIIVIESPCPRCIMTTYGFADLPHDPFVMRTLVRVADGNLGAYTSVEQAGRVQVGDVLERID